MSKLLNFYIPTKKVAHKSGAMQKNTTKQDNLPLAWC